MSTTPPLITLASVQEWLGQPGTPYPTTSNNLQTRLVASVSAFAVAYLQRPIAPAAFTEFYNGNGQSRMPLRQTPIISVSSLVVNTTPILPRPAVGQPGFAFDTTLLYLTPGYYSGAGYGYSTFVCGAQNVQVSYTAGYQTSDVQTVPAAPYIVDTLSLSQQWNSDRGVAYVSTGAALTLVTVAPTVAGTYQVATDPQGNAQYVFAPADTGASVTITYGYTPADVVQALVELAGERYKTQSRIGEVSRTMQGQVTAFSQRSMNAAIMALLQPYKNVVPVQ